MRRRGSDQVGRWPWGVWLALVGVSAGTVASFAAVGWAFLHAAGGAAVDGDAEPLAWDQDRVVIEDEETPGGEPEDEPPTEGAEPSAGALSAPEPEAATVAPSAEREPESAEAEPRLVPVEPEPPVEESGELVPIGGRGTDDRHDLSDGGSNRTTLIEQSNRK